jgi:hypothetical protein
MTEYEDKGGFVRVKAVILRPTAENVRCIELATGQVVYEFWVDGSQWMRFDADVLEEALKAARKMVREEMDL